MSAHDRFEAIAAKWHGSGRPTSLLIGGRSLVALRCWSYSVGAKVDGMSEALRAFLEASDAALPEGWLDDYLSHRDTCRQCGEGYRLENLLLCTDCARTYCYRCMSGGMSAANGNIACSCGGELVG